MNRTVKKALALVVCLSACAGSYALQIPYVLDNSTATLGDENPKSDFYKLEKDKGKESGSADSIFDYLFGNDSELGEFVELTWGDNPKPFLMGASLKAGSKKSTVDGLFAMFWGASSLEAFNASSSYNSIRIYQDGIVHKKHLDNYLGISHITFDGEFGTRNDYRDADVKVPDSGSAFWLLGIGLVGLLFFKKRMRTRA